MINIANANNEGTYTCTASNTVGITELIYNVRVGCKPFNSVLFIIIFPIVLPQLTLTLTIRLTTTSVIIEGVFTDSSPQNVHTFYVFVDSQVYKLDLNSFPLTLNITEFTAGQTYTVTVIAENIIGNSTVAMESFTVPSNNNSLLIVSFTVQ